MRPYDNLFLNIAANLRFSSQIGRPIFEILVNPTTSKVAMSAPKRRKIKFDTLLDAPGSGLSSALRINIVQHTYDRIPSFLWTFAKNSHLSDL